MARFDLKNQQLRSQTRSPRRCLHAGAFALGLLTTLASASSVRAHSQPGVSGILDQDAMGVHMLRLYQGLVQRDGDNWRFVCSKTYAGAGQDLAGPLPGGGTAIALPMGVAIMKRDGTVMPHPDPEAQQGLLTAFARSSDTLYALRWRDRLKVSDVVEITETTIRVLWTDTHYWSDLAVGEASLALVRVEQDEIEDLRLSFKGEVLAEDKAPLVDTLAVTVRVMGDVPYYAARLQNQTILGRIEQGAWRPVLMAGNALAGPILLADGTALVALDGVLSTFANDTATPLSDSDFVTGLYQLDGRPYACTRTGLRDLSSTGLGMPLFDMSELLEPNECVVPEEARSDCELEWQHLLIELIGANIPLATDATSDNVCPTKDNGGTGAADSGMAGAVSAAVAGAKAVTGAGGTAGSAPNDDGAGGAGPPDAGQHARQTSGCACGITPRAPRFAAVSAYTLLVASALFLRRRRK